MTSLRTERQLRRKHHCLSASVTCPMGTVSCPPAQLALSPTHAQQTRKSPSPLRSCITAACPPKMRAQMTPAQHLPEPPREASRTRRKTPRAPGTQRAAEHLQVPRLSPCTLRRTSQRYFCKSLMRPLSSSLWNWTLLKATSQSSWSRGSPPPRRRRPQRDCSSRALSVGSPTAVGPF